MREAPTAPPGALRSALTIVLVLFLLLILPHALVAQSTNELSYRVKAACLYNFLQFIEWPAEAYQKPDSPIVIGIYGDDPFAGSLTQIVDGERVGGRAIVVRQVKSIEEASVCQLVFVPGSNEPLHRKQLDALSHAHVLTVGESGNFAASGGGINFTTAGGKVRFEINTETIQAANLSVSSKLLRLARLVSTSHEDE